MPRPWRITYSGAKYHITSRGNGRQRIFYGNSDYERFLEQLKTALEQDEVILYAYVLMPNHYHLFLETPLGNIKRFMQRVNTAYSMYYRYKHAKPGHCFQGRYGAKLVDGDDYIIRLIRYLHLNPVKTSHMKKKVLSEKIKTLENFRWSSYRGYIDNNYNEDWIDYYWLTLMGRKTLRGNRMAYRRYMEEMLSADDEEFKEMLHISRYALGDKKFIDETESDLEEMHLAKICGEGDVYLPRQRVSDIEDIEKKVAEVYKIRITDLHEYGHRAGLAKGIAIELSCQLTGKSQREIGRYFGYTSDSSVVKQRKKIRILLSENKKIEKEFSRLKKNLFK